MALLANQERQVQLVPKVAMEYQGLLVPRESKVKKASKVRNIVIFGRWIFRLFIDTHAMIVSSFTCNM